MSDMPGLIRHRLQEQVRKSLTMPRHRYDDVFRPGIGTRVAQILFYPRTDPIVSWDIRTDESSEGDFVAYESTGTQKNPRMLLGYGRLELGLADLKSFLQELSGMRVSISVPTESRVTAHGPGYELAVFAGTDAGCRLGWKACSVPADWYGLTWRVLELIKKLKEAKLLPITV